MIEEHSICKEGIVHGIDGNNIEVEITISSACSECHAKSICMPSDHKQEFITATPLYGETFQVGERVALVLKNRAGQKAVILAYLIPFIVLMATLLISYAIFKNELVSVLVSIGFVALYYLILKRYRKKIDESFTFFVKKLQ